MEWYKRATRIIYKAMGNCGFGMIWPVDKGQEQWWGWQVLQKEGFETKGTEEVLGSQLGLRIVFVLLKVIYEMKDAI